MTESRFNQPRSRIAWQVYFGVGLLSALAGYVFSAYPLLIPAVTCAALAIWLIGAGLQAGTSESQMSVPHDLTEKSRTTAEFWRSAWKSRLRFRTES